MIIDETLLVQYVGFLTIALPFTWYGIIMMCELIQNRWAWLNDRKMGTNVIYDFCMIRLYRWYPSNVLDFKYQRYKNDTIDRFRCANFTNGALRVVIIPILGLPVLPIVVLMIMYFPLSTLIGILITASMYTVRYAIRLNTITKNLGK